LLFVHRKCSKKYPFAETLLKFFLLSITLEEIELKTKNRTEVPASAILGKIKAGQKPALWSQ
jgi:hypothetical protein